MLVDWEYAGMGHPLFDLGNLAVNNEFDDGDEERLLTAYYGAPARPPGARALKLMRIMSDAREAAWGVVQGAISDARLRLRRLRRRALRRASAAVAPPTQRLRRSACEMPRPRELPDRARVVIIGGGVGGASIAYHLAAAGRARRGRCSTATS